MPTRHGGSFSKNSSTWRRFNWRRMTTWPAASTPCTWKTDLAISKPIVVTVCMDSSSESWEPQQPHIRGTLVPVEEPSTASKSDLRPSPVNISANIGPDRFDLLHIQHTAPWRHL